MTQIIVLPHVEVCPDGAVMARVVQTIRDLDGKRLDGAQAHGLRDKTVGHLFHFEGDKVARFDIEETVPAGLADGD